MIYREGSQKFGHTWLFSNYHLSISILACLQASWTCLGFAWFMYNNFQLENAWYCLLYKLFSVWWCKCHLLMLSISGLSSDLASLFKTPTSRNSKEDWSSFWIVFLISIIAVRWCQLIIWILHLQNQVMTTRVVLHAGSHKMIKLFHPGSCSVFGWTAAIPGEVIIRQWISYIFVIGSSNRLSRWFTNGMITCNTVYSEFIYIYL